MPAHQHLEVPKSVRKKNSTLFVSLSLSLQRALYCFHLCFLEAEYWKSTFKVLPLQGDFLAVLGWPCKNSGIKQVPIRLSDSSYCSPRA